MENGTTTMSTTETPTMVLNSLETRVLTSAFYALLSSMGLVVYAFDMYVLWTHRASFANSFYILVAYCAVGDMLYLVNVVVYMVPHAVVGRFFAPRNVTILVGNGDTILFNVIFALLGPIAMNRLMAILGSLYPRMRSSRIYAIFIESQNVHMLAIGCWMYGVGICLALHFVAHCPKLFSFHSMTFGYYCADYGHPLFVYYASMCLIYPLVAFVLYLVMYALLKRHNAKVVTASTTGRSTTAKTTRREMMLLVQASIICFTFLVENVAFIYVRGYGYWGDVAITTLSIVNSSVNPIVYLVFNSTLRQKARGTMGLRDDHVFDVKHSHSRMHSNVKPLNVGGSMMMLASKKTERAASFARAVHY